MSVTNPITRPVTPRFGELNDLLGFNLRMAQNAMYRHYTERMAELDLTQRQFAVLELIDLNSGISQVEVAAALGIVRPAMMIVVDRLEGRGLVVRQRSERDRRRQELYLTAPGNELLARAKTVVWEHDRTFTGMFKDEDVALLVAQLRKIAGGSGNSALAGTEV